MQRLPQSLVGGRHSGPAAPAVRPGARPHRPRRLRLTGDLDAITPDSDAAKVARRFKRSRLVSVPNLGHVPDLDPSGCVSGIVTGFVAEGTPGPTACLKRIPPIAVDPAEVNRSRPGPRP
ncbi:alpha/beta hydrolase [Microtetraspora malaysiensis]|uniref:Alpha/beta hydrolase n=1 Tax=Microtetraspora malaysiensis TaxID=161358 RepID=A0ABW6T049_9ACTN